MIFTNAFSLQMLTQNQVVKYTFLTDEEARKIIQGGGWHSSVGHKELAEIMSKKFGVEIAFNRESNKIKIGDKLLVAQYMGGRLPEGATSLPEGAKIQFILAEVIG